MAEVLGQVGVQHGHGYAHAHGQQHLHGGHIVSHRPPAVALAPPPTVRVSGPPPALPLLQVRSGAAVPPGIPPQSAGTVPVRQAFQGQPKTWTKPEVLWKVSELVWALFPRDPKVQRDFAYWKGLGTSFFAGEGRFILEFMIPGAEACYDMNVAMMARHFATLYQTGLTRTSLTLGQPVHPMNNKEQHCYLSFPHTQYHCEYAGGQTVIYDGILLVNLNPQGQFAIFHFQAKKITELNVVHLRPAVDASASARGVTLHAVTKLPVLCHRRLKVARASMLLVPMIYEARKTSVKAARAMFARNTLISWVTKDGHHGFDSLDPALAAGLPAVKQQLVHHPRQTQGQSSIQIQGGGQQLAGHEKQTSHQLGKIVTQQKLENVVSSASSSISPPPPYATMPPGVGTRIPFAQQSSAGTYGGMQQSSVGPARAHSLCIDEATVRFVELTSAGLDPYEADQIVHHPQLHQQQAQQQAFVRGNGAPSYSYQGQAQFQAAGPPSGSFHNRVDPRTAAFQQHHQQQQLAQAQAAMFAEHQQQQQVYPGASSSQQQYGVMRGSNGVRGQKRRSCEDLDTWAISQAAAAADYHSAPLSGELDNVGSGNPPRKSSIGATGRPAKRPANHATITTSATPTMTTADPMSDSATSPAGAGMSPQRRLSKSKAPTKPRKPTAKQIKAAAAAAAAAVAHGGVNGAGMTGMTEGIL
ncbi:uncharacterized protein EV422DRAFT_534808 [Fimicolochytrium jonesii]|uniref:uncharacterized protein n=1 Tax=Fimicolochytrium jonesii TaxID=1396493 RepID=UPI0022FE6D70|nr:uncharacterized protein EV422DRAFT_534808 [Fimicolochytrium jonesii]KAI8819458.1 hypothetical protein EV422DRAFT_534808 [Fimicolochytrium jonesii]